MSKYNEQTDQFEVLPGSLDVTAADWAVTTTSASRPAFGFPTIASSALSTAPPISPDLFTPSYLVPFVSFQLSDSAGFASSDGSFYMAWATQNSLMAVAAPAVSYDRSWLLLVLNHRWGSEAESPSVEGVELVDLRIPAGQNYSAPRHLSVNLLEDAPGTDEIDETFGEEAWQTSSPIYVMTKGADGGSETPSRAVEVSSVIPVVTLDEISQADISTSGEYAEVTISGTVSDQFADMIPSGLGAEPLQVEIFVNGALYATVDLVEVELPSTGTWAPYPSVLNIPPTTVEFPVDAEGATISVVTSPNYFGKVGTDAVALNYDVTYTPGALHPERRITCTLAPQGSFSPNAPDVVKLTDSQGGVWDMLETGDATLTFTAAGTDLKLFFDAAYAATAAVDQLSCFIVDTGAPVMLVGGASGQPLTSESAPQSNVFNYDAVFVPAYQEDGDFTYALAGVVNIDTEKKGLFVPFSFAAGAPSDNVNFSFGVAGGAPISAVGFTAGGTLRPWESGYLPDNPMVFCILRAEAGRQVVYFDPRTNSITSSALASAILPVEISVAGETLGWPIPVSSAQWTDTQGVDVEVSENLKGSASMPVDSLVEFIDGGHAYMEISPEFLRGVRFEGLPVPGRIKVQSVEFPNDWFLLSTRQEDSRYGRLTEGDDGAFTAVDQILLYGSSPSQDLLTPEQWDDLKALGYLGVHNDDAIFGGIWKGAVEGKEQHHIFPQMGKGTAGVRARQFYKSIGMVGDMSIHQFTIEIDIGRHKDITQFDDIVPGKKSLNSQWRDFFNEHTTANGNPIGSKKAARRAMLDLMFEQAEDFKYDLADARKYPIKGRPYFTKGASMDKLMRLDEFDVPILKKGVGGTVAEKAKRKRWKKIEKSGLKKYGKKFVRLAPGLSTAFSVWAVVSFVAAPTETLAAELEISEELAGEVLAGNWDGLELGFNPPWAGSPLEAATLLDGSTIRVGGVFVVADLDAVTGIVRDVAFHTIVKIESTDRANVVDIETEPQGYSGQRALWPSRTSSKSDIPVEGERAPYGWMPGESPLNF